MTDYSTEEYILILSDEDDSTTDDVLNWLDYKEIPFIRINGTTSLSFDESTIDSELFYLHSEAKSRSINTKKIISYWYRRGKISFEMNFITDFNNSKLRNSCNQSLLREYNDILGFIYPSLDNKHGIGSIYNNQTNKLYNLKIARQHGLLIPDTVILTTKKKLLLFIKKHHKVLTKPIGQAGLVYEDEEMSLEGGSTLVSILKKLPDKFPPSLFQGYIEKAYELRIFYLDERCYSSAIFSQLDEQTKIDFRNYNHKKPNRTPPYALPKNISEKIVSFMKAIHLNSGSIDIIVTPKKEYIFLEVNPVGQFFQVSYPCNFYLEEKVADFLSKPFKYEQRN
jgi:ATP-GRASP peptide maturase of grasp-with-spasm system